MRAFADMIERQQAAAGRTVMTGAERQRRFDLDADVVRRHAAAIMRAVNDEAAGGDGLQSGETLADPVLRGDALEAQRLAGIVAAGSGGEFAHRGLVGRHDKMNGDAPYSLTRVWAALCSLSDIHKAHGNFIGGKALGKQIGNATRRQFTGFEYRQPGFGRGNRGVRTHCNPCLSQKITRNSQADIAATPIFSGANLFTASSPSCSWLFHKAFGKYLHRFVHFGTPYGVHIGPRLSAKR